MGVGVINTVHMLAASITLLSLLIWGGMCDEDKAKHDEAVMYTILHDIALPNFNDSAKIIERFILLSPGQVLDYYDYRPLNASDPVFINPSQLPPDENAFRLSDAMPTLNPLSGGTTGKTLSTIYNDIIYTINTTSNENDLFADKAYIDAMDDLQQMVPDPNSLSSPNVSRLQLYERYKLNYCLTNMQVQNWINGNKTDRTELEYEEWCKVNIESLNALTSAAKTQWLTDGQKGNVEDGLAIVDIQSSRGLIETGKSLLQEEALPSRDGGSSYYPVYYTPSNWYDYLLAEPSPLTYAQINSIINDLKARKDSLNGMIANSISSEDYKYMKDQLDLKVVDKVKVLNESTDTLNCYKYLCSCRRLNVTVNSDSDCKKYDNSSVDVCAEISKKEGGATDASGDVTEQQLDNDYTLQKLSAYDGSSEDMQTLLQQLNDQIANYTEQLKDAPVTLPPIASSANQSEYLTQDEIDKNWMVFAFDSKTSSSTTITDSKTYKTALSFSANGLFWSAGGGASYSRAEQDFAQQMSEADVSLSAKILRVTFSRSWFTPSLFSLANFTMQGGVEDVSPGPMLNESEYVNAAINTQLPEYTTGFLLAKDVSMRFRGVSNNATSHALQESASGTFSGGFGPFSVSSSFSYGHVSSNVQVSSESDGLQITMPGAQVIGYYVSVLPEFPAVSQ